MAQPTNDAFKPVISSFVELWRGAFQCAALMSRFGLAFWAPPRRRDESLAALASTMDLYMRTPAFLALAQRSLKMMSLGLPHSTMPLPTMGLPALLLLRRSF